MMALSRGDNKRRRKDDNNVLQESPKRTKVHAQRKFAQGSSNLTSPVITPVKDKVKVNGITPPSDVLPIKRPNTEDFLTFLCLRGSKVLPARLDFFSNASIPEPQDDDDIGGTSNNASMAGSSKTNMRGLHEKNNADKVPNNSANVRLRGQSTSAQGRAVKALKKKYHEQRLAKQKLTSLTKLVQKVQGRHVVHQTRYGTRAALQQGVTTKKSRPAQQTVAQNKIKKVVAVKPIRPIGSRRIPKHKQLRLGLRSGGQLPPGSDVGVKSPVRRPRHQRTSSSPIATPAALSKVASSNKNNNKVVMKSTTGTGTVSDSSSDDDQPLVKKFKKDEPVKTKTDGNKSIVTRSRHPPSSSNSTSNSRPSRKTKEAAALYMEMLGKDLRSPDEYDDDTLSVESFPELPNTKKIELREKELKALAEKNKEDKTINKKENVKQLITKNADTASKSLPTQKLDDRSKRMLMRNKAKSKFLAKERARKLKAKSLRKTSAIIARKIEIRKKQVPEFKEKTSVLQKKPQDDIKMTEKKLQEENVSNNIKKTEEKSKTLMKKPKKIFSKPEAFESRTLSSSSSSPQRLRASRTSSTSSERVLRTKKSAQIEDSFSESDEEPLEVLSAKLPKKKKISTPIKEELVSIVKKDVKESVKTTTQSHDRKSVAKFEKTKSPQRKMDVKDEKKVIKTDTKEDKKVTKSEIKEENKAVKTNTKEEKKLIKEASLNNKTELPKVDNSIKVLEKKKTDANHKGKIKNTQAMIVIDKNCNDQNVGSNKTDYKSMSKVEKKKSGRKKLDNKYLYNKNTKVPETKCEVKLENLDIRIAELRISKSETDDVPKIEKKEVIQNKFKENNETKKVIKIRDDVKNDVPVGKILSNPSEPPKLFTNITPSEIPAKKCADTETKSCKSVNENIKIVSKVDAIKSINVELKDKAEATSVKVNPKNVNDNCDKIDNNNKNIEALGGIPSVCTTSIEVKKPNASRNNEVCISDVNNVQVNSDTPNGSGNPRQVSLNVSKLKQTKSLTGNKKSINPKVSDNVDIVVAEKKVSHHTSKGDDSLKSEVKTLAAIDNKVIKKEGNKCNKLTVNRDIDVKSDKITATNVVEMKKSNEKAVSQTKKVIEKDVIPKEDFREVEKSEKIDQDNSGIVNNSNLLSVTPANICKKPLDTKVSVKSTSNEISDNTIENINAKLVQNITKLSASNSGSKLIDKPSCEVSNNNDASQAATAKCLDVKQKCDTLQEKTVMIVKSSKKVVNEVQSVVSKIPVDDSKKALVSFTGLLSSKTIKTEKSDINLVKPAVKSNDQKIFKDSIQILNPPLRKDDKVASKQKMNDGGVLNATVSSEIKIPIVPAPSIQIVAESAKVERSESKTMPKDSNEIIKTQALNKEKPNTKVVNSMLKNEKDVKSATDNTNKCSVNTVTKSRQSVNDTWRLAFKNAKIPKPGLCSPVTTSEKPFVRKPFSSSTLKKQINFDLMSGESSLNKPTVGQKSVTSNMKLINPFSVNKTPSSFNIAKTVTVGGTTTTTVLTSDCSTSAVTQETPKTNVIDPEILRMKEAEVEDIVRKYVGGELEKLHAKKNMTGMDDMNLVDSSMGSVVNLNSFEQRIQSPQTFVTKIIQNKPETMVVPEVITNVGHGKSIITFTTKSTSNVSPLIEERTYSDQLSVPEVTFIKSSSQSVKPLKTIESSPVIKAESNIIGGKHHHLPLPVEQTLKKLSQSKVPINRKPSVSITKQQEVSSNAQTLAASTSNKICKENEKAITQVKKSESCFESDIDELNSKGSGSINILTKKKVNMSTEDINKWLNDSTSVGIEHTKNCGIFEKNECECKPSTFIKMVVDQTVEENVSNKNSVSEDPVEKNVIAPAFETNEKRLPQNVIEVETIEKDASQSLVEFENVDKHILEEVSNKKKDSESVEKCLSKTKNITIANKDQVERKVNAAIPLSNKTCDVSSVKPENVASSSTKLINFPDREKVSSDIPNKIIQPFCDNLIINKQKISRGTNKMGDSETENSSRDPSEVSSPPPRDDASSTDESPEKFAYPERRSIFQQRRSVFRSKPILPRSPCAFSPENESSVYAFEPDLPPTNAPFRRNKSKEGRVVNQTEENSPSSASIAVQVNLDNESGVLECSTQTETNYEESEEQLFYIHLQRNTGDANCSNQQMIQGVTLKLGTDGPDQRVIMRAKLVTKPPTYAASASRPLVSTRDIKVSSPRPEQKVKPLSVSSNTPRPPVGTVQPTTRTPNPPEVQLPPPYAAPVKQTSTPEKVRKVSQSPENHKKEISVATPTTPDKSKKESETITDKPTKDVSAVVNADNAVSITQVVDEVKNEKSVESDKNQKSLPPPPPVNDKSTKSTTSNVTPAAKEFVPTPSTSGKPKRTKSKSSVSNDVKGTSGYDANVKLQDAPSFYPTEREFQDPLEYIEKIRSKAEKFGLCRIIPPANFKPECKVSDDMRFTAYNQYVHKMLHRWGPNVKEMLAIKRYLATQSIALTHPPWIGGMEVDLPKLYQTVQNCGGLKEVIEKKRWHRVADAMRIPKSAQDRVTKLDDIYCKFLLPYDTLSHEERTKLFEEVEKEWEKHISTSNETETSSEDSNDNSDLDECIVKGRNMALNAFYRIARNTMSMYFRNTDQPSAHEVEAEFWNHVGLRQSHVCVHSGSIDSGTNGYGFPTAKNSSTARHPWNLKVLTNNSGSILRSLGPIMGVTVPTLHVGMLFTACCWYRDPHGLPWIEYLHTGASKIWYGIPDESSKAFREVVMEMVPNLCRDKTIWLASDTAMIPPNMLVKRNISICRTVQEPGQFILVFPKAFTSSICTGYLVSESVYFAQPSWLATAQQVFKDISDSNEPSMFSLERLLFSIASDARSHVDVLLQVLPMVQSIKETEIVHRNELEKLGLTSSERLPLNKRRKSRLAHDDDSDYECETCRANLFLSLVTNTHEEAVYCMTHAIQLLTTKPDHLKYCKLLYTYDLEELDELVDKIKTRIEVKSQKKSQNLSWYFPHRQTGAGRRIVTCGRQPSA